MMSDAEVVYSGGRDMAVVAAQPSRGGDIAEIGRGSNSPPDHNTARDRRVQDVVVELEGGQQSGSDGGTDGYAPGPQESPAACRRDQILTVGRETLLLPRRQPRQQSSVFSTNSLLACFRAGLAIIS